MKLSARKTVSRADKASAPMVKVSKTTPEARRTPTHEEIAIRSFELYLERGCQPGHAEEDWLKAEAALSSRC